MMNVPFRRAGGLRGLSATIAGGQKYTKHNGKINEMVYSVRSMSGRVLKECWGHTYLEHPIGELATGIAPHVPLLTEREEPGGWNIEHLGSQEILEDELFRLRRKKSHCPSS